MPPHFLQVENVQKKGSVKSFLRPLQNGELSAEQLTHGVAEMGWCKMLGHRTILVFAVRAAVP